MRRQPLTCDRCGQAIERWEDAVFWVNQSMAEHLKLTWESWLPFWWKHRNPESPLPVLDTCTEWRIMHVLCYDRKGGDTVFAIMGEEMDTPLKAVDWTCKLARHHDWFRYTSWRGLIARLFGTEEEKDLHGMVMPL